MDWLKVCKENECRIRLCYILIFDEDYKDIG